MAEYLIDNPPAIRQWYDKRNRPLTGCTVLHTAEGVLDTIGPDTGAENTANFIRNRTTAGSYHDLVDSDSVIHLVPYRHGAYHDGTGSNNWALSISFACATSDWRKMSAEKRAGFLRNGARAFAEQQAYRRSIGAPLTELRRITKAQSDAGMSGFIAHGERDPGRRTDPGIVAPNLFPFDEFFAYCRAALAGTLSQEEDTMTPEQYTAVVGRLDRLIGGMDAVQPAVASIQVGLMDPTSGVRTLVVQLAGRDDVEIDAAQLATTLAPLLAPALASRVGATREDVEDAIREVLGGLDGVSA